MPSYTYRAVDNAGVPSEGIVDAATARDVIRLLQAQGLTVNAVDLAASVSAPSRLEAEHEEPASKYSALSAPVIRREHKLTWEDLKLFNEQILSILKSGLPLAPSLKTLCDDVRNPRLRPVLEDIHQGLERGETLSEVMGRHPRGFSPVYCALVRAGEQTGNLSGVFSTLTVYSERSLILKARLQEALAYPALVFVVAVVVAVYLLIAVIPNFSRNVLSGPLLESMGKGASGIVANFLFDLFSYRIPIAATIIVAPLAMLAVVWAMRASPKGHQALQAISLRLPLFGKLLYDASIARFSRALGILLASRIPLPDSMPLAATAAGNVKLVRAAEQATRFIEAGQPLSDSLLATGFFPSTYCWLLHAGEDRGSVDDTLLHLAEQAEQQADKSSGILMTLGGPAIISCSALLVGFLLISVYGLMYLTLGFFIAGDSVSGL